MVDRLSDSQRNAALAGLKDWVYDDASGAITRALKFRDFSEAFGFISRVALAAQAADHHPDWSNSYNRVTITLSTHDAGGLSEKDIALAKAIDALLA